LTQNIRSTFVVSGQDDGFGGSIVGGAAWVLASIFLAIAALEAQFAVFGMTVADEMFAAAMGAAWRGRKQRFLLPSQTNLSHYHRAYVFATPLRLHEKKSAVSVLVGAPSQGQIVELRQRRYVVTDVTPSLLPAASSQADAGRPEHLVSLSSIEDDALGEELQVVWEIETGVSVQEKLSLPNPQNGFDAPHYLDAFLDAVRWGTGSQADPPCPKKQGRIPRALSRLH
jgi:hypothetical protein